MGERCCLVLVEGWCCSHVHVCGDALCRPLKSSSTKAVNDAGGTTVSRVALV